LLMIHIIMKLPNAQHHRPAPGGRGYHQDGCADSVHALVMCLL
jgi:hypothetical protein